MREGPRTLVAAVGRAPVGMWGAWRIYSIPTGPDLRATVRPPLLDADSTREDSPATAPVDTPVGSMDGGGPLLSVRAILGGNEAQGYLASFRCKETDETLAVGSACGREVGSNGA